MPAYLPPEIVRLGTLAEITLGSVTFLTDDAMGGGDNGDAGSL